MSGVVSGSQIDNSGIVGAYPAGHIINIHHAQGPAGTQTITDSSNYEGTTIGWAGAVSSRASKLLAVIDFRVGGVQANSNATKASRFAIYERNSASAISMIAKGTDVSGGTNRNEYQYQFYNSGNTQEAGIETRQSITWMVTDCTGNIYWALELCGIGTNGTVYIASSVSNITVYEIV